MVSVPAALKRKTHILLSWPFSTAWHGLWLCTMFPFIIVLLSKSSEWQRNEEWLVSPSNVTPSCDQTIFVTEPLWRDKVKICLVCFELLLLTGIKEWNESELFHDHFISLFDPGGIRTIRDIHFTHRVVLSHAAVAFAENFAGHLGTVYFGYT